MSLDDFPTWTLLPFPALVLAIAILPIAIPRAWERRSFQGLVVGVCTVPVVAFLLLAARMHEVADATIAYVSFVATLGALYVTSGGVRLSGDLEARPSTNVALIVIPRASGTNIESWKIAGAMASLVSGAYVASSNRVGRSAGGTHFGGGGYAYAPEGRLLAVTSAAAPLQTFDLDPQIAASAQREYPCYVPELE